MGDRQIQMRWLNMSDLYIYNKYSSNRLIYQECVSVWTFVDDITAVFLLSFVVSLPIDI